MSTGPNTPTPADHEVTSGVRTVTSADGTAIAYHRAGSGPVIVFVPGAFNDRSTCAELAGLLADRFTVICPDRRGRGDSTDAIDADRAAEYRVQREVEDLTAVIDAEGGRAALFGFSSGAVLSLQAAAAGAPVGAVVAFEPPFALGGLAGGGDEELPARLAAMVAGNRPGDAVAEMQRAVGLPPEMIEQARRSPMWPALEAIAQTTVYDATITAAPNLPTAAMTEMDVPVLVLAGAGTWPGLRSAAAELPRHLHDARYAELADGAGHGIPAEPTASAVAEFLGGRALG